MVTLSSRETNAESPSVYGGRERYANDRSEIFAERYRPYLYEGMTILDVGSGRTPAIPVEQRPANCRYIGLDISAEELDIAPPGSYDEVYVRDLKIHEPSLDGRIDLAISWQVLEHIAPLKSAMDNVHAYLKPGGYFVAMLSGKNAHFAVLNRMIPEKVGVYAMKYLLNRPPDTVFRAHYDSCTYSGLRMVTQKWSNVEVDPHYVGAKYYGFSKLLSRLCLWYEDWAEGSDKRNLATHYTLVAEK